MTKNENLTSLDYLGIFEETLYDVPTAPEPVLEADPLGSLVGTVPVCQGPGPDVHLYHAPQTQALANEKDTLFTWDDSSCYGSMSESPSSGGGADCELQEPEAGVQSHKKRKTSDSSSSDVMSRPQRPEMHPFTLEGSLNSAINCQSLKLGHRLVTATDNACITDRLFKIYHDSFENALSYWLTERTCPYNRNPGASLISNLGPDWSNRLYHRVFRLDRLADAIRGRNLTQGEDKAASKAVNSAIVSFATQWAQSNRRANAKLRNGASKSLHLLNGSDPIPSLKWRSIERDSPVPVPQEFDRKLQVASWHEARNALKDAEGIESFRVVFAQIIFSLTQRPLEDEQELEGNDPKESSETSISSEEYYPSEDKAISECDALLSKLNLTIERDGPPVHLEQGVRLIHSLRSKMNIAGALGSDIFTELPLPRGRKSLSRTLNQIDATDRATVDLLFWLGIMFDTLSSAMYKKPLVVSDEDSNLWSNEAPQSSQGACSDGLWDDYLLNKDKSHRQSPPLRWPCSNEAASSLLCDAAPIRVLLFRKVTRLQTLLSRNIRNEKLERAISEALDVCCYWEKLYGPFLRDCVAHHDHLPPRIQSWYICLTGHWHLASLLLVDLIEIIDNAGLSLEAQRRNRTSNDFIASFRSRNCVALSDLARCAVPHEDSLTQATGTTLSPTSQPSLLTEPWTVVLIRAFAKAGTLLLFDGWASCTKQPLPGFDEEPFRRAEDCVDALWYLGRKSDMALLAAETLGKALKKKRKACEIVVGSMRELEFLNGDVWGGVPAGPEGLEAFFV